MTPTSGSFSSIRYNLCRCLPIYIAATFTVLGFPSAMLKLPLPPTEAPTDTRTVDTPAMLKAVTTIMAVASSSWLWQQAMVQIRDPVCLAVFGPPIPNPIRFPHPGSNTNFVAITTLQWQTPPITFAFKSLSQSLCLLTCCCTLQPLFFQLMLLMQI